MCKDTNYFRDFGDLFFHQSVVLVLCLLYAVIAGNGVHGNKRLVKAFIKPPY